MKRRGMGKKEMRLKKEEPKPRLNYNSELNVTQKSDNVLNSLLPQQSHKHISISKFLFFKFLCFPPNH